MTVMQRCHRGGLLRLPVYINQLLIPHFVQVAGCAKPLHLDRVPVFSDCSLGNLADAIP
jgi:hypothetical protein